MKRTAIFTLACVVAIIATGQELITKTETLPAYTTAAMFKWSETEYNFGEIKHQVPVTHEFTFTNTGSEPLVISSVKASCGCTVTDYSREPIPSGEKGYVKATYNAAAVGAFTKSVTINSNTEEGTVSLIIKGTVVE